MPEVTTPEQPMARKPSAMPGLRKGTSAGGLSSPARKGTVTNAVETRFRGSRESESWVCGRQKENNPSNMSDMEHLMTEGSSDQAETKPAHVFGGTESEANGASVEQRRDLDCLVQWEARRGMGVRRLGGACLYHCGQRCWAW